jgi:hypothetical protein
MHSGQGKCNDVSNWESQILLKDEWYSISTRRSPIDRKGQTRLAVALTRLPESCLKSFALVRVCEGQQVLEYRIEHHLDVTKQSRPKCRKRVKRQPAR